MSWNHVARWYRALEYAVYGRSLERCRRHFMASITGARRVLIIGDGDGRFLADLAAAAPNALIDALDASSAMTALARRRVERARRPKASVQFQCADIEKAHLRPAAYDLIVTHFFLDCFDERRLASVVQHIANAARPEALWLVSEFREPPQGIWKFAGRFLMAVMYLFFRLTAGLEARRVPHYAPLLESTGFHFEKRHTFWHGFLVSELWKHNA
jgi:SAM-dependent methyltransferase